MSGTHKHFCPQCGKEWECHESGPIWDQQDTDCRHYSLMWCEECHPSGHPGIHMSVART